MPRKRFKTEEIIQKLREAEVLLSLGRNVSEACRQIGVTDNTNHPGNSKRHPLNSADGSVVRHTKRYTLTRRVATATTLTTPSLCTWLMVKKDLERVGIPYITTDGVADFHAAGRHTHITELMRSGASVSEAMELARHSDVKMTMRYVHIGINDQARALVGLPVPEEPESKDEPGPSAAKAS